MEDIKKNQIELLEVKYIYIYTHTYYVYGIYKYMKIYVMNIYEI